MNQINEKNDNNVTVCICTYKRPQLLSNLLFELQKQVTRNLFKFEVVIVDNDANQSASDTVAYWTQKSEIQIDYFCEPRQNIALARNMAVKNTKNNLIAFIDDDEIPTSEWLLNLFITLRKYECAGALGPVKPHYPDNTPEWLIKSKICERPLYETGTVLNSDQTRTGNVLFNGKIFNDIDQLFNPEFGRTGGEDVEFFKRMIGIGNIFVWCNEATVYETVLSERWQRSFYLNKYTQMGGRSGELAKEWPFKIKLKFIAKAFISLGFHTLSLPFSFLGGQQLFMKCLLKEIYYISWFVGFISGPIIKNRY